MTPDRTDAVDRRTVLRASGAALTASVVGLAGCAEPDDGEGDDTPTPDEGDMDTPTPTPEDGDMDTPTPTPEDEDA